MRHSSLLSLALLVFMTSPLWGATKKRPAKTPTSQTKPVPTDPISNSVDLPSSTPQPSSNPSEPITTEKKKGVYNDAEVLKLDGTIMVQHPGDAYPTALQTGSTVQKGDILTVYDKSWVILKNHKGDQFGLDSGTVLAIDELYIEGPDRQIRFILQKGILFLRTNHSGSRQSFFEINCGSVVVSINDTRSILEYDPAKDQFKTQFLTGKLSVVDKDLEQKFKVEHCEHTWVNGKMVESIPEPVDEVDVVNYGKFFDGEPRIEPPSNNMIFQELENRRQK